jgi:hypothetical protein
LVKVFDVTGALRMSFNAYSKAFTGGLFVAAGDVNGDGREEVVTGPGAGFGPRVRAFDGNTGTMVLNFLVYETSFKGGVRVGTADANGDPTADILTGRGPGGGPEVRVFDSLSLAQLDAFFAYSPTFTGGIFIADD